MPTQRSFDFPISTLLRDAKRLLGALQATTFGPPVARRLRQKNPDPAQTPVEFAPGFAEQIALVEKGGSNQGAAVGDIGQLTQEQAAAYTEMERLMAGARRSASYAFPGNDPRLHSEFQVGIHEPQDLASELERAGKILVACRTHADALAEHGWLAEDADALAAALGILGGTDEEQEATKDQKKALTKARNLAANRLYAQCRTVQNAARLAFPSTLADKDDQVVAARARYLLDEFPPRGGASAGDQPTTPTPPPQ